MATRWSPDTCSCVLEYDEGINITAVVAACPKHAGNQPTDHLAAVLAHNRQKNRVLSWVVDNGPARGVAVDVLDGGAKMPRLRLAYDPQAAAGNDPLLITNHTLTTAQKNQLQNALDGAFGAGTVKVV